jgi:hypothetical protein
VSILKSDIQQNGLLLAIFSGKKESKMLALHFFWQNPTWQNRG